MTKQKNEIATVAPQSAACATTEEGTLMNLIAKMATDPNADVAKLERLIQLRDHVIAQEAQRLYDEDFAQMKPNLPTVIRAAYNDQTKKRYATLDSVNQAVDPVLSKFGFATSTRVMSQTETSVTVRAELIHKAGHKESTDITMPLDRTGIQGSVNKTGPHALSSSVTYAKRVAICALLNISTGDDKDGNAEPEDAELISIEHAADLDGKLRAISEDALARFLKRAKIEKLTDLPESQYPNALKLIAASAKQQGEKK